MFTRIFRKSEGAAAPISEELADIESGRIGQLLHSASEQIAPVPEFGRSLENRLRTSAHEEKQVRGARRLFERKAGRLVLVTASACLLLAVATLPLLSGVSQTVSAAEILNKASVAGVEVPEGKVRHTVMSFTNQELNGKETTFTSETWFSQANGRVVLRMADTRGESLVVNDGETVWHYFPKANTVDRMPAGSFTILDELNDKDVVRQMLKMPNSRVVEQTTLDGRNVTVIESIMNVPDIKVVTSPDGSSVTVTESSGETAQHDPAAQSAAASKGGSGRPAPAIDMPLMGPDLPQGASLYARVWVETDSSQILMQEFGFKEESGEVTIQGTSKLVLDETRDRSDFPTDLFTFQVPAGAEVRDMPVHPKAPPEIKQSDTPGNAETPVP